MVRPTAGLRFHQRARELPGRQHVLFSTPAFPTTSTPNAAIYALWDNLYVASGVSSVRTELVGTAPNRSFVIEWRSVQFLGSSTPVVGFEVVLSENGQVAPSSTPSWAAAGLAQGNSATIGDREQLGNRRPAVLVQPGRAQRRAGDCVLATGHHPTRKHPARRQRGAGDETIRTLPATASLSGTATDDGLPSPPATLTTTWSVVSGIGTVTFANPAALATTATFSIAGTYAPSADGERRCCPPSTTSSSP